MLNRSSRHNEKTLHDVGTLWAMHQGQQYARCALMTKADAWELHLLIDGQSVKAARCPRGAAAFELADKWKRRLGEQGWRQVIPRLSGSARSPVQLRLVVS